LLRLQSQYHCKLIHANDSHYIYPKQANDRAKFLKGKGMNYADEDSFILDYPDYNTIVERYHQQGLLADWQIKEALDNTLVFDNCEDLYFDKEIKMPTIYPNEDSNEKLKTILVQKWKEEKPNVNPDKIPQYLQAINYEYQIVKETNMADYFLLNERIVALAKEKYNGVLTRTGRGSAVSFYINKLLGFTEIDRLESEVPLYPTRFMSVARILQTRSLPDIDQNWADVSAPIQATKELLGEDGVYYMYALGTMKESSAFRNLCRAYDMDMNEYNEVAKNLDQFRNDKKWQPIIEEAQKFIGVIDSVAPSPCSFVLSNKQLSRELGLIRVGDVICASIDGYTADVWKFLKNDYLTVKVWKIISDCYKLLNKPIPNIRQLKKLLDDNVWNLYRDGLTATLNQADTDISTSMLKRYKPRNVAEMSGFVAAIRPGFASLVNTFLNREEYSTGVDEIDKILEPSYHFMLYQESIMAFLVWCGLPEDHTYDIIKKISKKKFTPEKQEELRLELIKGYQNNLGTEEGFEEIWQVVNDAARYSFNASHSLSVAWDSLYGAELKTHYPLEYYTTVLNEYQNDTEKTGRIISELSSFGISLENIKFGKSKSVYSFDKDAKTIYKSVSSIKFCNEQVADELYNVSQNHTFESFTDVLKAIKSETSINTRQLQILTTLNYFSDYGKNKKLLQIINLYETLADRKQVKKNDIEKLHINETLFKSYCAKETDKMYKDIDIAGYINEISSNFENKSLSVKEQIQFEMQYLEYITYTNSKVPNTLYYVSEFKTYKDITKPYLMLYNLNTGVILKTKVTEGKKFSENPFKQGNLINVKKFKDKNKMKMINGSWQKTSEIEKVVSEWETY
jgi:DNA polymerase III alpha subunit